MPSLDLSILFSENNYDEFILLLTPYEIENHHDIFLEEFRQRGFRRCYHDPIYFFLHGRDVAKLFDPETKAETSPQNIDRESFIREPYSQVMRFKTNWKSETMALGIAQGWHEPIRRIFSPHEELTEDIERHQLKDKAMISKDEALSEYQETIVASSSGYGTASTFSKYGDGSAASTSSHGKSKLAKWGVKLTSVVRTAVTGKPEFLHDVERSVRFRLQIPEDGGGVESWLDTLQTRSAIPDILTTEDKDRKLGNVRETTVGPEGETISLRSYQISIPPNAVKIKTKFKFRVSIEMDLLEYPPNLIPISLPLYCSPGDVDFLAPVSLKFPTWVRKVSLSPKSPPIPVYVYTMRKGEDWQCVESAELTTSGLVEFQCDHFCVNAAFIRASDAERVMFVLEHILFKDSADIYSTCHFLSSDASVSAMLQYLEKNHQILHPPTYTSLARVGDEIHVDLVSETPEIFAFETRDDRVLKIDEYFYTMNRRESLSFLLTPKPVPVDYIEFTFVIGDRKFIKRDILKKDQPGMQEMLRVSSEHGEEENTFSEDEN